MSVIEIERVTRVSDELVEAFELLMPQLTRFSPVPTREELEDLLSSGSSTLVAARAGPDGPIQGLLTLVLFRTPAGVHAWIEDVVVDEAARGQGIGAALTRAGLDLAARRGAKTVNLTSRPAREAANRLYQRLGFVRRETNLYEYKLKD